MTDYQKAMSESRLFATEFFMHGQKKWGHVITDRIEDFNEAERIASLNGRGEIVIGVVDARLTRLRNPEEINRCIANLCREGN